MRKAKSQRHNDEREPGESAEGHRRKFFRDQIAEQKSAPENFLDARNDKHEPEEASDEREPIQGRLVGDGVGIEAKNARREIQPLLRRNPEDENKQSDDDRENRTAQPMELIFAPKVNKDGAAEERLQRVNPEFRGCSPERACCFFPQAV